MEDIMQLLKSPFEKLEGNSEKFQSKCSDIATKLIQYFCIECGTKKYYFAEIEFYYYKVGLWDEEWNKKTYPRTGKKAGDFFFHYSGVDICFDSEFKKGEFGGILIRSLKDTDGNFITGPSVCSLEIMNTCFAQKSWPKITSASNDRCEVCKEPITRYGINYKDNQEDKHLCFYDERLKDHLKNDFNDATWDFSINKDGKVNGPKKLSRNYYRFNH